jgi:hypothetical protein
MNVFLFGRPMLTLARYLNCKMFVMITLLQYSHNSAVFDTILTDNPCIKSIAATRTHGRSFINQCIILTSVML